MAMTLLEPPTNSTPQTALHLSQQAPAFLKSQSGWKVPYPLSLFLNTESQEKWATYENMFHACLRTGDNDSAYACLEALTDRFGKLNERVMAMQGLYQEATAKSDAELVEVVKAYNDLLTEDPTLFAIRKRRAALFRSAGKTADAITALTDLLDSSPTDAEAWAELADVYLSQGMYEQSIFCLEEVLLVMPNAWNMHARLGEVELLAAGKMEDGSADQLKMLSESMRRSCRSVELCDDYLRGYYGLKISTSRLLDVLGSAKKPPPASSDSLAGDLATPTVATVKKLNELATSKLAEIVRKGSSGESGWDGYSPAELQSARELLEQGTQKIQR